MTIINRCISWEISQRSLSVQTEVVLKETSLFFRWEIPGKHLCFSHPQQRINNIPAHPTVGKFSLRPDAQWWLMNLSCLQQWADLLGRNSVLLKEISNTYSISSANFNHAINVLPGMEPWHRAIKLYKQPLLAYYYCNTGKG